MKTESKPLSPPPLDDQPAPYGAGPPYESEFLDTPAQRHAAWFALYCSAITGLCAQIKTYTVKEPCDLDEEYERYDALPQQARVIASNAFQEMCVAVGEHEAKAADEIAAFNAKLNAKLSGN